jgi:hypothetical protein
MRGRSSGPARLSRWFGLCNLGQPLYYESPKDARIDDARFTKLSFINQMVLHWRKMKMARTALIMGYLQILLFAAACNSAATGEYASDVADCDTIVRFGEGSICLPNVDGWSQSLGNIDWGDRWGVFVDEANVTFGVYLSEKQLALGDELKYAVFDDYFKLYAPKRSTQYKVTTHQLSELIQQFNGSALKASWNDVETLLEGKAGNVDLSVPVLMETYRLHDKVGTSLYLMRAVTNGVEQYNLMTISMVVINEHLMFVAHYLNYTGSHAVAMAKGKSDYFNLRLLDQNPD